jgi:hypothetical protein
VQEKREAAAMILRNIQESFALELETMQASIER